MPEAECQTGLCSHLLGHHLQLCFFLDHPWLPPVSTTDSRACFHGGEGRRNWYWLLTLFQHEQVALRLGEKVQCNFKDWDIPGWKPVSPGDGCSGVWGQERWFLGFLGPRRAGTCIFHVGLSHSWAQLSPHTSRWGKVVKISTKSFWGPSSLCFWGCSSSSPTKLSQIFPECLEKLNARSISTQRSMRQGMETSLVLPGLILHGAQHISLEMIPWVILRWNQGLMNPGTPYPWALLERAFLVDEKQNFSCREV